MTPENYLNGGVQKWVLPVLSPGPGAAPENLKRLALPQGELAQVHNGEPAIQYIAFIELREGSTRGNHFHKAKQEYIYVLEGEVRLLLEHLGSTFRDETTLTKGDLAFISPGIAHALQVRRSGQAIEFSPQRFDGADIYRHTVRES
jgi:quercetin dioxygenase-like cupin family protein